ncbi:TolC family outer membrane protein [Kalamiella sp. sgz302252]|uniref:TolC family outer membrane protein n=1 Tax=Pantoea sp. sgz302252 TaxID=3341827 RepID=UPI0036D25F33
MTLIRIYWLLLLLSFAGHASAMTILKAYTLALEHAPSYLAALKEKEAGGEEENIALAGLLPEIAASYQNSRNRQKQEYVQQTLSGPNKAIDHNDYASYSGSVTLTQPLFDYQAITRYRAAQAQKLMADERYRARLQELAIKVTEACLALAYAQEAVKLAGLKKHAFLEQLSANRRLLQAGEGSITDVTESDARYHLAIAEEIEVNNELDAARRELEAIIGAPVRNIPLLNGLTSAKFRALPLKTLDFQTWQKLALANNPSLRAIRQELEAKRYEVEQYRGGHFPVVQLYASHTLNDSATDNTLHQKYRTSSVGVRVKVPFYSGGGISAATRKATAEYSQRKYQLEENTATTLNDLKRVYNGYISSRTRIQALSLAMDAARKQVVATRKSVFAGHRVNLDILNAEQQLYSAQLDLINEKYNHIKYWAGLLSKAGLLEINDLAIIDKHFSQAN